VGLQDHEADVGLVEAHHLPHGDGKPQFICRKTATLWRRLLPSIRD
jgi:hypothetical protein